MFHPEGKEISFVNFSSFRTDVKRILISEYGLLEEDAVSLIYAYREAFPKLLSNTTAADVAARLIRDKNGENVQWYLDYLDLMNYAIHSLADSKQIPDTKNKQVEICVKCQKFKYVNENCTFCFKS